MRCAPYILPEKLGLVGSERILLTADSPRVVGLEGPGNHSTEFQGLAKFGDRSV